VTIPLAFALRNHWALVAGMLVGRTGSVALTYVMHPYRPRFSLAERRDLFHFGKWLVTGTFINVLATRSADFLIGKMSGAHALGVYTVSYEISNLPTTDVVAPINRAMLPGYAKKAAHLPVLAASYLEVVGLIAVIVAPAAFGIAAVANLMVPVVLGPNWVETGPVIATLAFFGLLLALKTNNHYVYLALGRPRMTTIVGLVQILFLLPLLTWGSFRNGALGAAQGCVIAELLFSPLSIALLRRELQLRHLDMYRPFIRPLVAGAAMYFVVRLVEARLLGGAGVVEDIFALLGCVLVGAVVYPAVILALWLAAGRPPTAERRVLEFVRDKVWLRWRSPRVVHR
jgi:O-antigen/teichoic acid export membrane protein